MAFLDPWFPVLLYWIARNYREKGADEIEDNVEPYQDIINPEGHISSRGKNPKILEKDGSFNSEDHKTVGTSSDSYSLQ